MRLFIFLVLTSVIAIGQPAGSQPATIQLAEGVSIQFPTQPERRDMGPATLYTLRLADSTANFNAIVSDLQKGNGLDAETLEAAKLDPVFWEQTEQAFLASLGPNAKLKESKRKTVSNSEALELTIERAQDGKVSTLLVLIFTHGVYSFNVVYTNRNGQGSPALQDAFFSSIQIK
ncbi:MAG TPA: hypothetical protein PKD90_01545 [Phnomibacter sp.]|nr:hypothetical protein [Phnomibacter sp.]